MSCRLLITDYRLLNYRLHCLLYRYGFDSRQDQACRESRRRDGATRTGRFRDGGGIGSLLLAAGFCLVAVAINVWPIDPMPYHYQGQYVPRDLYARVSFKMLSPKKAADEESRRKMSTPAVFGPSESVAKFLADLQEFADAFKTTSGPSEPSELVRDSWKITPQSLAAWRALSDPDSAGSSAGWWRNWARTSRKRPSSIRPSTRPRWTAAPET